MKIAPVCVLALAAASALSGCSALDAMHTANVATALSEAGVIDGPAAGADVVALRTGTASYTGLGVVAASDGTFATAYLGDVTMLVDFDSAAVSGSIDMYRGKGGLDPATDPEAFFDMVNADPTGFLLSMNEASGAVQLTDGTISGGGITVNASSGALTYGGTTTVVTGGTVGGEFTGSTANGIRSTSSDVTGTVNGSAGSVEIYFGAAE